LLPIHSNQKVAVAAQREGGTTIAENVVVKYFLGMNLFSKS
jgi:hypothetical protein